MQVPNEVRKCVAFVCFNSSKGIKLAGTAFFVAVKAREVNYVFGYVVTAKHVIAGIQQASIDDKALLRVNMREGPSKLVETRISDWKFHPNDPTVDIAVSPLWLPQDKVDFLPIPMERAATDEVIKNESIGVGDEVFLTGLFVNHFGRNRNLPIVRVGNIALMPEEPIQTKLGPIDAILVEARSLGGLSGSPVFVHLGQSRTVGTVTRLGSGIRFYWLGLMHGHWDVETVGDEALLEDIFSRERVNMGIAIVVPVSKILEVINQDDFKKGREKIVEEGQKGLEASQREAKPLS